MAEVKKDVKSKSKDEIIIDLLNHHISKGNIDKTKVKLYKDKIK